MNTIRITKQFFFESAHALSGYDGKCKNVHGHSYIFSVTVIGKTLEDNTHPKNGMVMDFGDLKKIVKKEIVDVYDHATILNSNSKDKELGEALEQRGHRVIYSPYQPTSEMMLVEFAAKIIDKLPKNIKLHSLKLYETGTSYAEWFAFDNKDS